MKVNGYKYITIVTILAVFLLQTIWLYNSFCVAVDKLTADVNDLFIQCLFEELDTRFTTVPPNTHIQGSNNPSPKYNNYEYINNGIYNLCHRDVDIQTLAKILNQNIRQSKVPIHYILYKVSNKKKTIVYKDKCFHTNIIGAIKSDIIPTRINQKEGIQIEFINPFALYFQELGLLVFISLILCLFVLICIIKQVSIIRIQQENARTQKDFSYAMIHDMKTPLSTISMGINALDVPSIRGNEKLRLKYLKVIKNENKHLYQLINRILTISKVESGKLTLNKAIIALEPLINNIENNLSINSQKEITFQNIINESQVFADKEYLSEVFYNLIDNSIKYSDNSVQIKIISYKIEGGVNIHIRDNGIGISKEDQKIIFDKFERASASKHTFSKGGAPGFGLGLNYVLHVIETHKGMVSVDSELGKYTEFTIFLPDKNEDSRGGEEKLD
mgnify:CR=1 FL=1